MAAAFCFKSFNTAPLGEASRGSIAGDGGTRACAHYGYSNMFIPFILLVVCHILEILVGYSVWGAQMQQFSSIPVIFQSFFIVDAHGRMAHVFFGSR